MKGITYRIAISIISCSLVLCAVLTGVSVYLSKGFLLNEAEEKIKFLAASYANAFGIEVSHVENTVDTLYSTIYTSFDVKAYSKNPKAYLAEFNAYINPIIKKNAELVQDIHGIYFTPNPELTQSWNEIWYADLKDQHQFELVDMHIKDLREFNANNHLFDYYFKAVNSRKPIWIDPYVDGTISVYMVSYVRPIIKEGYVIGVIGSDLKIEEIAKTIKDMKVYQTGFSMLINDKEEVIIHPALNRTEPLKIVSDGAYTTVKLSSKSGEEHLTYLNYEGTQSVLAYSSLPNGWTLAIQAPVNEALSNATQMGKTLLYIGIIGLIITSGIAFFFAHRLAKYIESKSIEVETTKIQLAESERIAALTYLVSGVANEINTPVGNAITLTTFIGEEAEKTAKSVEHNDVKKQQLMTVLNEINESSVQVFRNLNETQKIINAFKELASTKTSGSVSYFEIAGVIDKQFSSLMSQWPGHDVQLEVYGDTHLMLYGDSKLFGQMIYHLIHNSILHGFDNRTKGLITIDLRSVNNGTELIYTDNGKGISSEMLSHIYVPFFSTKVSSQNKGLGMNVIYNIVRGAFSGSITVESPEEKGIVIKMTLHNVSKLSEEMNIKMH